jgi:uncharacterized membrane-anchored protein
MKSNEPNFNKSARNTEISSSLKKNYLNSTKLIPFWHLLLLLCIQTVIILAFPITRLYTQYTGKTFTLQSIPIYPSDTLRAKYLVLEYKISRLETLSKLPGWKELINQYPGTNAQYYPIAEGTNIYVIMQQDKSKSQVWEPLRITNTLPTKLPVNQIALHGTYRYGSIIYGLEKYQFSQKEADYFNQDTFQTRQISLGRQQPITMKIKVDIWGNAVPISMQINDMNQKGQK